MINRKKFKDLFLEEISNFELKLRNKIPLDKELENISLIRNLITKEYYNEKDITKFRERSILNIIYDIKNLENLLYRYNTFIKLSMSKEAEDETQKIITYILNIKEKYHQTFKKNVDSNQILQYIMIFLQKHIRAVGENQTVKDIQKGLNILNKNKRQSPIVAKLVLEEDGIWGNKTQACFCDICKNYTPRIIKKYIKKGAINNAIFETKNNSAINTQNLVKQISNNLDYRKENQNE